jgi:cell division septation protein DedD
MVSQTSTAICALCKTPLEARAQLQPSAARLCEKCCSMIEKIFPQAATRSAAIQAPVLTPPAPPPVAPPVVVEPQNGLMADHGLLLPTGPPQFNESPLGDILGNAPGYQTAFVQAEEDFAPTHPTEPGEFYFEDLADAAPSTNGHEPPPGQSQDVLLSQFSSAHEDEQPEGVAQRAPGFSDLPEENFTPQDNLPENGFYAANADLAENLAEPIGVISDFPYLVEDKQRKRSQSKALPALIGLALLGVLVAGFFFIYKPFFAASEGEPAAKPPARIADDKAPVKAAAGGADLSAAGGSAKPADAKNAAADTKKTDEAKPAETSPATEINHNEAGQFALQAGVFSTEANAAKLADQLKRAGIPAYVSAPKGNKYRVLVGKFASSGEAQKYIAQAQARASTAGIKLELFAAEINP